MKKVINITIGGLVFGVEQDAYDALTDYLANIKVYLHDSADSKEIIDDIERAIAEKFVARGRSEKVAVTMDDVSFVIAELGTPEAIADGNETVAEQATENTGATSEETTSARRRLFRDPDDVVVAGVASGIGMYLAIDPVLVRLAFVILTLFTGFGILLYILLWLIVPVARTTAEKYAMRGERVTLSHITSRIKSSVDKVREGEDAQLRSVWYKVRSILAKVFTLFGIIVRALMTLLRYLVGIGLVFGGALGIAAAVSGLSVVLSGEYDWIGPEVQIVFDIFNATTVGHLTMGAFFVAVFLPLVLIIMLGTTLLTRRNPFTLTKVITLGVVWVAAVALFATSIALQMDTFQDEFEAYDDSRTEEEAPEAPLPPAFDIEPIVIE